MDRLAEKNFFLRVGVPKSLKGKASTYKQTDGQTDRQTMSSSRKKNFSKNPTTVNQTDGQTDSPVPSEDNPSVGEAVPCDQPQCEDAGNRETAEEEKSAEKPDIVAGKAKAKPKAKKARAPTNIAGEMNGAVALFNVEQECEARGKAFRMTAQRQFLTFSNMEKQVAKGRLSKAITKEDLRGHIFAKIGKSFPKKSVYIAKEFHKDGNTHFHVLFDLQKACDWKNCHKFDLEGWHPNWQYVKDFANYNEVCCYISKSDKETGVPKNCQVAQSVLRAESLFEALATNRTKMMDAKMLWEAKPKRQMRKKQYENFVPRPWQQQLLDCIGLDDDRIIYAFINPKGCAGKTTIGKYLKLNKLAWKCKKIGSTEDFMMNINTQIERGWDGECVVLDLPFSAENTISLYECIEALKDGEGTATKYHGGDIEVSDWCTVILTLNWWPQLDRVILDRWRLFEIVDPLLPAVPVDAYKMSKQQNAAGKGRRGRKGDEDTIDEIQ